ncbi:MAG: LytTR family DNA-binding domain-containing protein [Bacteroidota bacterium]
MIKTVIIDDEPNSRELLANMLELQRQKIELLGTANDVPSGIELIRTTRPELVFLDIEMPGGDGFEVLNAFKEIFFKVIIVTGYDQYAIKAIKYAAMDYLLKPIDLEELDLAIVKFEASKGKNETNNVHFLKSNYTRGAKEEMSQIVLPGHKKYAVVQLDEIIKIEAQGNYAIFYLENQETHIVTHSLSYYEELLPSNLFFRIHKSYIINCMKVESYEPGRAGQVFLIDGTALSIAARRKVAFKKIIQALTG